MIKPKLGYTLIEILIVMLIVSIVGVASLLSISSNKNTRLQNFAKELTNLISLAEQQAMLQPAVLGLAFTKDTLQFYRYEPAQNTVKAHWVALDDSVLGRKHRLPKNVYLHLDMADQPDPAAKNFTPPIIITASGSLTPFVLAIGERNAPASFNVTGSADGSIVYASAHDEK